MFTTCVALSTFHKGKLYSFQHFNSVLKSIRGKMEKFGHADNIHGKPFNLSEVRSVAIIKI